MSDQMADLLILGKIYTADPNLAAGACTEKKSGKICEADPQKKFAEAMAVLNGKILAVGTEAELEALCGPQTEVIRAEGLVMPGIVEGHAHVTCASEMVLGVALGHEEEPEGYLKKIKSWMDKNLCTGRAGQKASSDPDESSERERADPAAERIFGSGYDNGVFGPEGPTAALLDSVCPDRPVVMVASDHHSRWINSKALALCGITDSTPDPENGQIVRDAFGKATGWLKETAMALANPALPEMTAEVYAKAVRYYQNIAVSYGVTTVFEPMFDPLRDYALRAEGYRLLDETGDLWLTARLGWSLEEDDDFDRGLENMKRLREHLKSCRHVQLTAAKFFVDGVVECHTAWLKKPYADSDSCGTPCIGRDRLFHDSLAALREGFDLHMHVIGDAAADLAADAIIHAQNILAAEGKKDFRNALTHLQLVDGDTMKKIAENRIHCVVNPYWHYFSPSYYDALEKPFLGEERALGEYPMRSLVSAGAELSQATDFPVTVSPDTMDSLHLMVNRTEPGVSDALPLNKAECLTVSEALDILTIGGAKQLRLEGSKGSLTPGKDADFILLSGDPFAMDPETLSTLEVEQTYIAGVCRYRRLS